MLSLSQYLYRDYTWQKLTLIFIAALLIRFTLFELYIQHEERYKQADSFDYHVCAACIKSGNGMTRFDTKETIYWRTPGYPLFLSFFYAWYNISKPDFSSNKKAQKAAILIQIFLCSFIPLLIFFLTRLLTGLLPISWIAAWIGVFHLGFILASCFILSDALAHIFFLGFLYFFYQSFVLWFEQKNKKLTTQTMIFNTFISALLLGLYTWIRPNGQYLVFVVLFIMLFGQCSWRLKISKITLFTVIFFATLAGWYVRNHTITGHWFFCPMSGPYLQTFCAPKIMRRVSGKSLDYCIKYILSHVGPEMKKETIRLSKEAPHLQPCKELICSKIAKPWIIQYPRYFLYDWTKEVLKTTFDLYGSQLVSLVNKTHMWDPAEEFLSEKLMLCLFTQPMPWFMRFICWIEALYYILIWIGILAGSLLFLLQPLIARRFNEPALQKTQAAWIKSGLLIGALLIMTGGFGYARLRIPADPLLIILSLTFWYYIIAHYTLQPTKRKYYETPLRSMAQCIYSFDSKIKR